jgi:hypothetical protein
LHHHTHRVVEERLAHLGLNICQPYIADFHSREPP